MATLTLLRTALLALVAGALTTTCAQAQNAPAAGQAATTAPSPTAAERPMLVLPQDVTIDMRRPPAPEENSAFYDNSHKDLLHALAWIQETNAVAPTYWNLYTESCILLKMNDYLAARAVAEKAYTLALKSMPVSKEYVMLTANVVAKTHLLAKQ